jgi:hypothetical protein
MCTFGSKQAAFTRQKVRYTFVFQANFQQQRLRAIKKSTNVRKMLNFSLLGSVKQISHPLPLYPLNIAVLPEVIVY